MQAPYKHCAGTMLAPDEHGTSPADSPLLIPDSGLPYKHCAGTMQAAGPFGTKKVCDGAEPRNKVR